MIRIGSINYKNGEMPEVMKWLYRMSLLYNGYVDCHKVEFSEFGGLIHRYEIIGHTPTGGRVKLDLTIDPASGFMSGRTEYTRDAVPVYKLGRAEPVKYLSRVNWNNIGDEQSGQEYKSISEWQ